MLKVLLRYNRLNFKIIILHILTYIQKSEYKYINFQNSYILLLGFIHFERNRHLYIRQTTFFQHSVVGINYCQ